MDVASLLALAGGAVALFRGRSSTAVRFALGAAGGQVAARWLSRRYPSPFRAHFRALLYHSPGEQRRVCETLVPLPGERVLELGPGPGHYSVAVAQRLGPQGTLCAVDIQPAMLAALDRRARRFGIANLEAVVADACRRLPFQDETFDAAYMCSVLGELPDPTTTATEIHRLLPSRGRLMIVETFLFDPDFMTLRAVRDLAGRAGFRVEKVRCRPTSFLAVLRKV